MKVRLIIVMNGKGEKLMSTEYEKINLLTKLRMEAWEKGNKYDDENNYKKANEELEKYGMLLEIEKDYWDWINNKKTSNDCDGIKIIDDVYTKNFVNEIFKEIDGEIQPRTKGEIAAAAEKETYAEIINSIKQSCMKYVIIETRISKDDPVISYPIAYVDDLEAAKSLFNFYINSEYESKGNRNYKLIIRLKENKEGVEEDIACEVKKLI